MEQDKHQRLQELFSKRQELRSLLEHPGWKQLVAVLEQMTRQRRIELFQRDITGLDVCFQLSRSQGEVAGLQLPQVLLNTLIADCDADISVIQNELEEMRGEDNA